MKILIATDHLANIAGSEMVCLEFAARFRSLGHDVTLFANVAARPMTAILRARLGLDVVNEPARIAPFAYDLVYFQHHVAGLFDYRMVVGARERTAFVFGRLGRRSFMESGGWHHDGILADHHFANSELTAETLAALGTAAPITNFRNAAPDVFFRDAPTPSSGLKTITVVSNHRDPALMEAVDLLSPGRDVRQLGYSCGRPALVTPEMIQTSDLVISIGKTVPYALAARVPVYVYDHFGGPGYLDERNFARAARYNFTGRCCERLLDAEALTREIVADYRKGVAFARDIPDDLLARYRLEPYLDAMLAIPPSANAPRAAALAIDPMIGIERLMACHVRDQRLSEQTRRRGLEPMLVEHATLRCEQLRRWSRRLKARLGGWLARLRQSFSA